MKFQVRDVPADRGGYVPFNPDDPELPVPIFYGGKAGRLGAVGAAADAETAAQLQEHWRLMYVALTRAEDMLFIGGALPKAPPKLPEASWYAWIAAAMAENFTLAVEDDAIWGTRRTHRGGAGDPVPDGVAERAVPPPLALPGWATVPAPPEARPPRPLSPSKLAEDDVAQPPPSPAMQRAAARGKLLHTLFEQLPAVAPAVRAQTALAWAARKAGDFDAAEQAALVAQALAVIDAPAHAALFGPDALAEAPIAARVGDIVVAGKVDRLLVTATEVQVIDFKTGNRVPNRPEDVELYHLRQMAAYVAALAKIFPDRPVRAALLFTAAARLIELPPALLAAHAPAV